MEGLLLLLTNLTLFEMSSNFPLVATQQMSAEDTKARNKWLALRKQLLEEDETFTKTLPPEYQKWKALVETPKCHREDTYQQFKHQDDIFNEMKRTTLSGGEDFA